MKEKTKKIVTSKERDSSIELFRIITMLVIIAHHYLFHSGLFEQIIINNNISVNSIFLLLFGWGGKVGINCFLMITGYFMCKSNITIKKFLKLLFEVELYNIVIYFIFVISGYTHISFNGVINAILPFTSLNTNFIGCYLIFFLFIPFINILINNMEKKSHFLLICLCLFIFSFLPILNINISFSYISWFIVVYLIASYIRIYPKEWFNDRKKCGILSLMSLLSCFLSVLIGIWLSKYFGGSVKVYYYFVIEANKVLAISTAVFAFLFFKNIKINYNKYINLIASATFGVLLIHDNGILMREWLWKNILNTVSYYNSNYLVVHAIISVLMVYIVCVIIDIIRIKVLEKPFFKWYDKSINKFKK